MPNVKQLVRELAKYAMSKKGARQSPYSDPAEPSVDLPGGASWTEFFTVEQDEDECITRLPVHADALKRHCKKHPAIRKSAWAERDGHVYMEIPLDRAPPIELFKSLIDEAYAIVWNKLDANDRMMVELAGLPYDEESLMDR